MVTQYGDWKNVFLVYGATSVLVGLWLMFTSVEESSSEVKATFGSALSLLKKPFVALTVMAIFLIVGLDVGINTNIQNLLTQRFDVSLEKASLAISIYFTALMITRFLGAILLSKINNLKFLLWSALATVLLLLGLIFSTSVLMAHIMIFLMGITSGNFFPIVFSLTVNKMPERANEISGLMIMAVVGGAIIPPLMGLINTNFGVQLSFGVLVLCAAYVFMTYFIFKKRA